MSRSRFLLALVTAACLSACSAAAPASQGRAGPQLGEPGYVQVAKFPHDPGAYTQGLEFLGTQLYEGTGLEGASSLRRVDLVTGDVQEQVDLADHLFGEGITIFGGRIYQITWQNEKCFVYDVETFDRLRRFRYEGEGWGLTHNRKRLVMSDGTNVIRFRDPKTFEVTREIQVTRDGEPVIYLNELEWIEGEIFANVWQTDEVVRIDPATGEVTGSLDLSALHEQENAAGGNPEVTNGIAYMKVEDRLFVTGKRWSNVYEIELTDIVP